MYRVNLLAVVAAVVGPALAQLSALPSCALAPATSAIGQSGCAVTNITCICSNQAFISSLEPAIAADCSPSDQQQALSAAEVLCASAGVTLSIPAGTAAPASSSVTASTSAAMTTAASSSSSAAATSRASSSSTPYPYTYPTSSLTSVRPANATTTGNATAAGSTSVQPFTGAANPTAVLQMAAGAVVAGAGIVLALA